MVGQVLLFAIFRVIHLAAVIVAIGGTVMLRYVVMPALHAQPDEVRQPIHERVLRRLAVLYPTAIGLILISGIVNLVRAFTVPPTPPMAYHMILTVKLVLAFTLFTVAILLVLPGNYGIQTRRPFWLTFNVHAGLLIVILSVALRFLSGK